ncbi:hypothetical protein TWF281_004203 [Arthrobotrys megalospora]
MYSTSTSSRSPPQSRSTSPWYARFPELDPADNYSQSWPPRMLGIADEELRRIAFLPRAGLSPFDPELQRNERVEYLGEGILTALVSDFLYTEFIEYPQDGLLAMRQALLDSTVLSNISQRIGLPQYLPGSPPEHHQEEHSFALLFQVYVGALYNDRGSEGYPRIRDWFYILIKPYAMMCKSNYDQYLGSHRGPRNIQFSSPSRRGGYSSSGYSGYELADPSMIARPGTAAPDLGMYANPSSGSRSVGDSIKELKEYCEKNHWAPPVYYDQDNEGNGDFIRWKSEVTIDGSLFGRSTDWAKSKKIARAMASQVALNNLRGR